MRHRRTRIVLLCLLALVWCQLAAAAQLCGPVTAEASATMPPGCHDDPGAVACMATDCPAGYALKDATGVAFHAITPVPVRFVPIAILGPAPSRASDQTGLLATGPPPHLVARLLI